MILVYPAANAVLRLNGAMEEERPVAAPPKSIFPPPLPAPASGREVALTHGWRTGPTSRLASLAR